ncbi:helix-turn-helix domain-containing protein [Pediococcus siamensis]|uniref:helix-turn-helix domain-containing protein n=1 Tax=Pediococcus siamensis TaxID=381829 RepID=UPI0039A3A6F9
MTHGDLIKKLRKERQLSQAQLAAGISSRTTLSTFENNHSRVSSDILFAYLERMNISIQEYLFYFNGNTATEKERITQYFYDNVVKRTDQEIMKRIHQYRTRYKNSNDFYFCCLSIELKLFLNHKHQHAVFDVAEDVALVKRYLERVQQWGHFEMALFSNCLYIFSSTYIRGTFAVLLKRTQIISEIDTYQNDLAVFLNNCIILAFERRQLTDVRFFTRELCKRSAQTPRKAYDRMMGTFYSELLNSIETETWSTPETIQQFKRLGFTEHAAELAAFAKKTQAAFCPQSA